MCEQLSSQNIDSNKRAYKTLCSLDLSPKSWDALLTLATMKTIFAHFGHESLRMDLMEALVSVFSASEYPVRRMYACQMLPVVIKAVQTCDSAPFLDGCLALCISFMEVIGEPAAAQCIPVVDRVASLYRVSSGRSRLRMAEFFESLSEDQLLPSIPCTESSGLRFDDETMAQLCLLSAMMNNDTISSLHAIDQLARFIDAFRKECCGGAGGARASVQQTDCLRKVYELLANAFCDEAVTSTIDPSKHLEALIADDARTYLDGPVEGLTPSILNAFANYLNAVGQCSLDSDRVEGLKCGLIKLLRDGEQVDQTASTNLLRAMSLTCDFTLTTEEESSIYSSLQSNFEAASNVAQIVFFCRPSAERESFIRSCLHCSAPTCIVEYVDSVVQFGGSVDKKTILDALLRAESLTTNGFCRDKIEELRRLIK